MTRQKMLGVLWEKKMGSPYEGIEFIVEKLWCRQNKQSSRNYLRTNIAYLKVVQMSTLNYHMPETI